MTRLALVPVWSDTSVLAFHNEPPAGAESPPARNPSPPAEVQPPALAPVPRPTAQAPTGPAWWIVAAGDDRTPAARADAEAMAAQLGEAAVVAGATTRVTLLTGEDARPDTLCAAIDAAAGAARPGDKLLVYLAGRGAAEHTAASVEATIQLNGRSMRLAEIGSRLQATTADPVVVLDVGYNPGPRGPDDGLRLSRADLSRAFEGARTVLITSEPDNDALLVVDQTHGLLSAAVMASFNGQADRNRDGWISVGELSGYLSAHVTRDAYLNQSRYQFPLVQGPAGTALWPSGQRP